jgi:hypothetical protein
LYHDDTTLRRAESVGTEGASLSVKYLLGTNLLKRLGGVRRHPLLRSDPDLRIIWRFNSLAYLSYLSTQHGLHQVGGAKEIWTEDQRAAMSSRIRWRALT